MVDCDPIADAMDLAGGSVVALTPLGVGGFPRELRFCPCRIGCPSGAALRWMCI